MLKDQFGRIHDYLRISLTERCNLRCVYCMPAEGVELSPNAQLMNANEIESIVSSFVQLGIKKIRLTGGEPLVRKDFSDILERLSKFPVELNITTNGILLDRYLDEMIGAGLKKINVSLDTLDKNKFTEITRRNDFDKVLSNIDLLLHKGLQPKINCVLMKGMNEAEIVSFVELTKNKPLHIKFIEFMPFRGNKWDTSKCVSSAEIMDLLTKHFGEDQIQKIVDGPNSTSRNYQIKNHIGKFGIISTVTNPFCDGCNRIRLTANGKMKNCLFSKTESDLLSAMRNGEDITKLIIESIASKQKERGGLKVFEGNNKEEIDTNRSMILIGG